MAMMREDETTDEEEEEVEEVVVVVIGEISGTIVMETDGKEVDGVEEADVEEEIVSRLAHTRDELPKRPTPSLSSSSSSGRRSPEQSSSAAGDAFESWGRQSEGSSSPSRPPSGPRTYLHRFCCCLCC